MSSNPKIKQLMDEVENIATDDISKLEEKLNEIAMKVAEEQKRVKEAVTGTSAVPVIAGDPADAFACEGCQ